MSFRCCATNTLVFEVGMQPGQFYESLAIDKSPLDALRFNPYYLPLDGLRQGRPRVRGETYFDLASNDYLGLASDKRIHEAMTEAIREYGASMCGTPIATGYAPILAELERQLARFTGLEAAVVFPSCYQANVALFGCIATRQDVIFVDHYAHASLGQGIRAAGCKVKPFLHNDLQHLQRQLEAAAGFRQIFVVTESVFSTEGSIAPLGEIVELCGRYNAIPVVDDSHGIGVLGKSGRGILEEKAIANYPGIYTASLGKALGNAGGVIAGNNLLVDALRYACPGLIYSTALPPSCAAGALCALEIIRNEFARLGPTMWDNHRCLLDTLRRRGLDLRSGPAPIAAIHGGSAENTLVLAREFFDHRILATPFVPPSVPDGKGTLRLIIGAKLDDSGMKELMRALDGLSLPGFTPQHPVSPADGGAPAGKLPEPDALSGAPRTTRRGGTARATYLFIANPSARDGRARKKLDQLRSELGRRRVKFDLALCEGLEHARTLSEEANRSGCDVVVGVGGDGTINRVLNGFFDANGQRLSSARMGAIHVGTSPDFCRSYGVPLDVPAAVEALLAGVTRQIRVGKVVWETSPERPHGSASRTAFFGCCANIGLGASLARLANGGIRKYAGDFVGTFACLLRVLLQYRPQTMTLEMDGRPQKLDKLYNIAVGKTHYIASGIKVRHELQEQDDRLYVMCLRDLSWSRLGHVLWTLYRGKPIASGRCLSMAYAKHIRLDAASARPEVEFDGDPAGWCPCRIETAPDSLDLIVGQPS